MNNCPEAAPVLSAPVLSAPVLHTDDMMLAAFHAAPAALAIVDQFGILVARNSAFEDVVGGPHRFGMGQPATFDRLFALTDQPGVRMLLSAARAGMATDEARLLTGNGDVRLVRIKATRVDTLGRGPMVAISVIDPATLHATGVSNDGDDEIGRIKLATLYHELRTPLNAIKGFGEMLAGDVLRHGIAHQYRAYAEHIVGAATRLLSSFERAMAVRPRRRARTGAALDGAPCQAGPGQAAPGQAANVVKLRPAGGAIQKSL